MINNGIQTVVATLYLFVAITASADHHIPDEIKGKVQSFYTQMSAGNFEEALKNVKPGGRGYLATGLLMEVSEIPGAMSVAAKQMK